ncbi:hypothetical protein ACF09C_00560 [Streptomyces sp. NPDC014870]|uniref:hypothetical protein n=1 Tax=Streptomyces sp. NPDC014870 TaxID=3364925 RepID=UPI0036F8C649
MEGARGEAREETPGQVTWRDPDQPSDFLLGVDGDILLIEAGVVADGGVEKGREIAREAVREQLQRPLPGPLVGAEPGLDASFHLRPQRSVRAVALEPYDGPRKPLLLDQSGCHRRLPGTRRLDEHGVEVAAGGDERGLMPGQAPVLEERLHFAALPVLGDPVPQPLRQHTPPLPQGPGPSPSSDRFGDLRRGVPPRVLQQLHERAVGLFDL